GEGGPPPRAAAPPQGGGGGGGEPITATASVPRNSTVTATPSGSRSSDSQKVRVIDTSTTPSAATSRSSRRVRPRRSARAIAHSAIEPKRRRRKTTPGGPSVAKSDFATAAPPCTEHAAASTRPTADPRLFLERKGG